MPAWEQEKPARPHKGKYRPGFPLDYVVVDTETTGLDRYSCVIEAAALRVRGGQVAAEFSTLIQPPRRELYRNGEWQEGFVEPFITQLTGITDSMLETAPLPEEALPRLLDFLGDDPILGHNVHFDVNMLYDDLTRCLGCPLPNDFFDTLRLSRKLLPQLPHHRLGDVAAALGVPYPGAHRALGDCRITQACYLALRDLAHARYTEEELARLFDKKKKPPAPKPAADPSHPFFRQAGGLRRGPLHPHPPPGQGAGTKRRRHPGRQRVRRPRGLLGRRRGRPPRPPRQRRHPPQ